MSFFVALGFKMVKVEVLSYQYFAMHIDLNVYLMDK